MEQMLVGFIKGMLSYDSFMVLVSIIGVLLLLPVIATAIENFIKKYSSFDNINIISEFSWGSSLFIIIAFLGGAVLNVHNSNNVDLQLSWQYANAILIVLFYCLYIIKKQSILWLNLLFPFSLYVGLLIYDHLNIDVLELLSVLVIGCVAYFIYKRKDSIIDNVIYYATELIFSGAYWLVLNKFYRFNIQLIIFLVLEFMIVMTIIHFGNIEIRKFIDRYMNLEEKSDYDFLTKIRNRRSFDEISKEVYEVYTNSNLSATMVMFDIDHFKLFNDQYGHQIGDKVLKTVAKVFTDELMNRRANAQMFRVGGEEFAIIFRNRSSDEITPIIKEIRDVLVDTPFYVDNKNKTKITISIGIATLKDEKSFSEFYKRVDNYLYMSKNNQRNSITVEGNVSSLM